MMVRCLDLRRMITRRDLTGRGMAGCILAHRVCHRVLIKSIELSLLLMNKILLLLDISRIQLGDIIGLTLCLPYYKLEL